MVISSSNIIQTLCHYEKINSLIKDNSNNINVWLDSMTSAINQLRQRFPTYNDLIQPFTASLTLVCNVMVMVMPNGNGNVMYVYVYVCMYVRTYIRM